MRLEYPLYCSVMLTLVQGRSTVAAKKVSGYWSSPVLLSSMYCRLPRYIESEMLVLVCLISLYVHKNPSRIQ